jgi:uridylate kinase
MDLTAVSLCQENDLPMVVFNMDIPGNLVKLAEGMPVGTTIDNNQKAEEKN